MKENKKKENKKEQGRYEAPQLTVVSFRMERGFANSPGQEPPLWLNSEADGGSSSESFVNEGSLWSY